MKTPLKALIPKRKRNFSSVTPDMALARKAAARCVVLLKNEGNLLPLKKGAKLGLAGPFADSLSVLGGWSITASAGNSTLLRGLQLHGAEVKTAMTEELKPMQMGFFDVSDQTAELENLADCDIVHCRRRRTPGRHRRIRQPDHPPPLPQPGKDAGKAPRYGQEGCRRPLQRPPAGDQAGSALLRRGGPGLVPRQ